MKQFGVLKNVRFTLGALVIFCSSSAFAGFLNAPITWGAPTNISGDTDVATTGSLVAAFNMNGSSVPLNGVTFAAFTFPFMPTTASNGNFTFNESPGHILGPTGLGSSSAPFSNLSTNYQTLLSTAISTDDNNTLTLTMNGLTIGQQYEFQWWLNASNTNDSGFVYRTTASAISNVSLDDNTANAVGGTGQFAIGTFTAVSSAEQITFTGTDSTQAPTVNAFQLRAAPEPATFALFTIGALVVTVRRARTLRREAASLSESV